MASLTSRIQGGTILGQLFDVSAVNTNGRPHRLGTRLTDDLGRTWMYGDAGEALTGQGYVVASDASFVILLLTTAIANTFPQHVGVIGTDGAPASGDDVWFCLDKPSGDTELGIRVSATANADAPLYTTSTAGELHSAVTNAPIDNVRLLTAQGGSAGVNTASEWHYMARGILGT